MSRRDILTAVWGTNWVGNEHLVDVHIAHVRRKLGAASRHVRTVRGVGYRFEEDA
jgi:DNA-binding response OmpR family regulator